VNWFDKQCVYLSFVLSWKKQRFLRKKFWVVFLCNVEAVCLLWGEKLISSLVDMEFVLRWGECEHRLLMAEHVCNCTFFPPKQMKTEFTCKHCFVQSDALYSFQGSRPRDDGLTRKKLTKKKSNRHIFQCKLHGFFKNIPFHNFSYTVELHFSGLIGMTSLPDKQKIRIIVLFFENKLLWHSEVEINF